MCLIVDANRFGDVLVIPQTAVVERWQLNEE